MTKVVKKFTVIAVLFAGISLFNTLNAQSASDLQGINWKNSSDCLVAISTASQQQHASEMTTVRADGSQQFKAIFYKKVESEITAGVSVPTAVLNGFNHATQSAPSADEDSHQAAFAEMVELLKI